MIVGPIGNYHYSRIEDEGDKRRPELVKSFFTILCYRIDVALWNSRRNKAFYLRVSPSISLLQDWHITF